MIYKAIGILVIILIGIYTFKKLTFINTVKKESDSTIIYTSPSLIVKTYIFAIFFLFIMGIINVLSSNNLSSTFSCYIVLIIPSLIAQYEKSIIILKKETIIISMKKTINLDEIKKIEIGNDKKDKMIKLYLTKDLYHPIKGRDEYEILELYKLLTGVKEENLNLI